ncbi:unnamed protein product [Haemonchus placei]|uniref:Ubiquitin-like domain-containing protein n=1 Tax=Haemonchus placei TaxID=6290 RepID=A0A0N4W8N1_HAEPC|nr:unnamed protein product [Haemonchus placei]
MTIMPSDSSTHSKTATIKLYMNRIPRLTITYKDKHDLYEAFKTKTRELGLLIGTVFWIDDDGEPIRLNNANTLMGIAKNSSVLHIYATVAEQGEDSSCSCCEELARCRRPWNGRHRSRSHTRRRNRSHSRGERSRSAERSSSSDRSRRTRHHHGHHPFLGLENFDDSLPDPWCGQWTPPICCARGGFGPRGGFSGRGGFGSRGGSRGGGRGRGFHFH